MRVEILAEHGYHEALLGIGLSYGLTSGKSLSEFRQDEKLVQRLEGIARKLVKRGGAHAKFLESIAVWLDITAPRFWWCQVDTYRVGITKQSESTMHTAMKERLRQKDFERPIYWGTLDQLNTLIKVKDFDSLKNELPEGFLQRRIVCTNYKVLSHIVEQRHDHKLEQWQYFCHVLFENLGYPHLISAWSSIVLRE
jgi:hypothetical protein